MHRRDRRDCRPYKVWIVSKTLSCYYKDYRVSYVSKWIKNFYNGNSSKVLQVHFIYLVIFMYRWDRRDCRPCKVWIVSKTLSCYYKDYRVSYVSKWIKNFYNGNSSKVLQVHFIYLVIFMYRWDRRDCRPCKVWIVSKTLSCYYKDYRVSYVSKWIKNFYNGNSSKVLQVHFIYLVIFIHRWDRRDCRPCKVWIVSKTLSRYAPVTTAIPLRAAR